MAKKTTFEQDLIKLEDIVTNLEKNDVDLEESVKLYKEGLNTATKCIKTLQNIEQEVFVLKQNAEGLFELNPFNNIEGEYIE